MNLKRGLLRLWLVLALVWITSTTWLWWDEITATVTRPTFHVTTSDERKISFEGPEGATKEQASDHFMTELRAGRMPGLPATAPITVTDVTEEFEADWPSRREAIVPILLPPLCVLVLGIGLFWAIQGFRGHS
jgi:hypothetical protein